MAKYRIVKREKIRGDGYIMTRFIIQKKLLFWWFDYGTKVLYHTLRESNYSPCHMGFITRRVILFADYEAAKAHLSSVKKPFSEKYKGEDIGVVFAEGASSLIYINWSHYRLRFDSKGYEHHENLDKLKMLIDKRQFKIKQTVL